MTTTQSRDVILGTLQSHSDDLRRLGVRRIGLFGSHLHGTAGTDSDIDLLVRFDRASFDDYMDLKFLLEEIFGCKVDLVTETALKPALRHVRNEAAYVQGL